MNYTETFDQFASRATPMDLALYAGVGLILWVLFKDKLGPVQTFFAGLADKLKAKTTNANPALSKPAMADKKEEDIFFKLIVSWKQTRDLAVHCGCGDAIKVIDQMFPFLSPKSCQENQENKEIKV